MDESNKEAQEQLMQSAVNGATSLALMAVFLVFTLLPVYWLYDKMSGWLQTTGLVALSLMTAFLLMLFFTGLVKSAVRNLFALLSPEYRAFLDR